MAKCPKCDYKLKLWDIKAECPSCGVNIPNYNWEERLEQDSERAESAFKVFNEKIANLKKGLFGNSFFIARFLLTFVPLVALLLPIAKIQWFFPYMNADANNISILNVALELFGGFEINSVFALAKSAALGTTFIFLILAIALIFFGVVIAVANFFVLVIKSFSLKYKTNVTLCIISLLSFAFSALFIAKFFSGMDSTSIQFVTGRISYGLFVGSVMFLVNAVMNIIAIKKLKKP